GDADLPGRRGGNAGLLQRAGGARARHASRGDRRDAADRVGDALGADGCRRPSARARAAAARDRGRGAAAGARTALDPRPRWHAPPHLLDRGAARPRDRSGPGSGRVLLGERAVKVRLWGTRGSVAAPGAETARFGGNTACVEVRGRDGTVVVLDAGTGIRPLGVA